MESEVLAGRRDALWFARPGRAEVSHVAVSENGRNWFAACASGRHLRGKRCRPLVGDLLRPAREVHPNGRCRHPGCRVRWPAYQPR